MRRGRRRGKVKALDLDEYVSSLKNKRVAVIGIGVSNMPLIRLLRDAGVDVTARDREKKGEELNVRLITGEGYLDGIDEDVVFRSPGIRPDRIRLRPGAVLTSEMEAFFELCPCPIIGVTGSDGKTTTATVTARLLEAAGKKVWLGGNIGRPLLADCGSISPGDRAVVELSSFQLMSMRRSPQTAIITNIAPNHLDWHTSMDEYVQAKKNIFLHQKPGDVFVTNADNAVTRSFASESTRFFSMKEKPEHGCVYDGENIYYDGEEIVKRRDILLPGDHNIENYMAAFAAVYDTVGKEVCVKTARSFAGVEHRIELVRELRGVRYYNDSIASSPSRCIAGLRSFEGRVILIAGGYDKHIPYDVLGPVINEKVKTLVLTGQTAPKIKEAVLAAAGEKPRIIETDDFRQAVLAAAASAEAGDAVLLSPASASFDKFKNFEERGNYFKKTVSELK
ncbi:MAG: UDP-N-acetylmuramoyl-L-alanine--D-glutamate ligase [Oscillospiraceae bacterium]|nr:UDP-N-acetylmuramoyl-L-alanine--D-glutamate ligase [Oscillospiraceae bacterium]